MNTSKYPAERPAGKQHVPLFPKGFIAIRYIQLVLSVIVIALAAYGIWWFAFDGDVFILAVGIMTLIASTYRLVCEHAAPIIYNYWAILGIDVLLVILWLCSFALLASRVAYVFTLAAYYTSASYLDSYEFDYCYDSLDSWPYERTHSEIVDLCTTQAVDMTAPSCLAAAAALGGVEFVLYVISLSIHSVMVHRHRSAGLHCTPDSRGPSSSDPVVIHHVVEDKGQQQQPVPAYLAANCQQQALVPTYTQPYGQQPQQATQLQHQPQPDMAPQQQPAQQQQQQFQQPRQQPETNYPPQPTPSPLVTEPTSRSYGMVQNAPTPGSEPQQQQQPNPQSNYP